MDKIVPQKQFSTLEEFVREMNNFKLHFLDNFIGVSHRSSSHFKRFQKLYGDFEAELTSEVSSSPFNLPHEKLFEAYRLMSNLVYADDDFVNEPGHCPETYLCR